MTIPFKQYLLPDGRTKMIGFDGTAEIEALAKTFLAAGGWFEVEILTTGQVSLTACLRVDDEDQDVEMELCRNDESILPAVDKLVRAAALHAPAGTS